MKKITLLCLMTVLMLFGQAYSQTPPANDNLANAVVLTMGASCTNDFFTNTGATVEANEPVGTCFTGATHTVWFSFTAPASGAVSISTDILPGNMGDTQIALYPAPTNPNDLSTLPAEVGCDQDGGTVVASGASSYMSVLEAGGLTAGNTYYIQVDGWNGVTGDFCIQVSEVTCPNPSNINISNITGTSVQINWTENGLATIWDIELGPSGFTPTGTPTADDVSNPYTATGLSRSTSYDVYVRSDCGSGDVSEWVGPLGFATVGCFENFYDSGGVNGTYGNNEDYTQTFAPNIQGNIVTVTFSSFDVQADFDALYVYDGPDATYPLIDSGNPATFSGFPAGGYYGTNVPGPFISTDPSGALTFVFKSNGFTTRSGWEAIVDCNLPPDCPNPDNLYASNIGQNSADLGWNDNAGATSWDVEIVLAGTLPTGNPTASGVSNPYNATGLISGTSYEFYVRAQCNAGGFSNFTGPFAFSTTICQPTNQCDYTFRMTDSFGDGWNGGFMEVKQNGILLATLQLTTTGPTAGLGPEDVLVPICEGLPMELFWTDGGTFASEIGIEVIDGLGNTVYTMPSGSGNLAGTSLYSDVGICTTQTCPRPTNLAVANVTSSTADLSWIEAGTATLWDIAIIPTGGGFPTAPTVSGLNSTTYNATNLTAATGYDFYVRADCGGGDLSFWAGPFTFNTQLCQASDQCDYTFRMTDSFGDGWNGNAMEVRQNGIFVATIELTTTGPTSGSGPEDVLVPICNGVPFELVWATPGGFTNEVSVEIIDSDGNLIFSMPSNSGNLAGTTLFAGTGFCPTCPTPSALTVSNIMTTSADLGWTESGTATTWDIDIVAPGTPPSSTPSNPGETNNPFNATSLTPGTSYEFYVRADCGAGDLSNWAGPFAFTTTCLPYGSFTENFDLLSLGDMPACWDTIISSTSTTPFVQVTDLNSVSPPNSLEMNSSSSSSTNLFAVTPELTDLPVGTHQMRFQARAEGGASLEIGTMSDPNDETTFTSVQTLSTTNAYQQFVVPFTTSTTDSYIAFKSSSTANNAINNIDDVFWEIVPSCPQPSGLNVANITVNSADLSWVDNAGATVWDIALIPVGSGPPTAPTLSGVTANNPYNATVLTAATGYDFYVRSDCGAGDLSNWAGPFTFYTSCDPTNTCNYTFRMTDSFGDGWNMAIMEVIQDGNVVATLTGPATTGPDDMLVSICGGIPFELFWTDGGNFSTEVGIEIIDPFGYSIYTKPSGSGTPGTTLFTTVSNCIPPTCPNPVSLTATGIMAYSASLGWTENGTATLWDVEVVLAGTTPAGTPTATGVNNPYNVTGLNAATDYEFYVRADCGGGDYSDWVGPFSFTTACGVVFAPISENFASGSTPLCWIEGGLTSWKYSTSASFAASTAGDHTPGGGTNYAWMDGSDNEDGEASTLTTYPVDISGLSEPALEFYLFSNNTNDVAINEVEVEIFDGLNFYKVLDLNKLIGPNWRRFVIDLSNYSFAGPIQVIFTVTGEDNKTGDTQHNDILLDDVAFIESPCSAPTGVTVGNIGFAGADVTWTAGSVETEWEVEYGPAGFTPGTGTVIIDNDGNPGISLTGLDPGTAYDVYVTAVCTVDIKSQSLPATFTTDLDCPPITGFAVTAGTTSIDLAWTPGGTETGWIIEFGPAGFTPGTGTIVVDTDGNAGEFIIGLLPDTDYDVYVTPLCGGKDGDLFGPTTFHTPNLGIDEVAFEGFAFFPNPVENRLFLKATGEMEKVAIYNLLGQRVLEIRPESMTSELDLSGLQTGTYVMEVMINGSQAVFKVIKE